MPIISNETIRAIYELCGDDRFPVDEYCIGCGNCEHYGFPCANCAFYVFGNQLGRGERGEPGFGGDSDMEVDTPRQSDNEIPCNAQWDDDGEEEPASPTASEASVTSPSYIDPDSPLGLLISFSQN